MAAWERQAERFAATPKLRLRANPPQHPSQVGIVLENQYVRLEWPYSPF